MMVNMQLSQRCDFSRHHRQHANPDACVVCPSDDARSCIGARRSVSRFSSEVLGKHQAKRAKINRHFCLAWWCATELGHPSKYIRGHDTGPRGDIWGRYRGNQLPQPLEEPRLSAVGRLRRSDWRHTISYGRERTGNH